MVTLSDTAKSQCRFHLAYNLATPASDRARLERSMNEIADSWTVTRIDNLLTRCEAAYNLTQLSAGDLSIDEQQEITGDVVRTTKAKNRDPFGRRQRYYLLETSQLALTLGVRNYRDPEQAIGGYLIDGGTYIKSIPGAQGDQGEKGTSWYSISGAPTASNPSLAILGDFCLNANTGEYYNKSALVDPAWTLLGDIAIEGPSGPTGGTGSVEAASAVKLIEQASDPSAEASKTLVYAKTDHKVYKRIPDGTISELGVGGSGSSGREVLTDNRTYYIRTDGSDSNTGLTNTSGGAFLTIQKGIDKASSLDFSTFNVTLEIAAGTHNLTNPIYLKDWIGNGQLTVNGAGSTTIIDIPNTITSKPNFCLIATGNTQSPIIQNLQLKVSNTNSTSEQHRGLIRAEKGGKIRLKTITFGTSGHNGYGAQLFCETGGNITLLSSTFTLAGSAPSGSSAYRFQFARSTGAIFWEAPSTVNASVNLNYSNFIEILGGSIQCWLTGAGGGGTTFVAGGFSHSAKKYDVQINGVLLHFNGTGNANSFLLGSSNGTTGTGGIDG